MLGARTGLAFAAILCGLATASAQNAPKTVWDGVYSAEQAERGKATYDRFCAVCHGSGLTGSPGGPPLLGADFAFSFDAQPVAELVQFIKLRMPVENPDSLSPQQATNIAAHILRGNGFPAGQKDLSTDFDEQADILIKVKK